MDAINSLSIETVAGRAGFNLVTPGNHSVSFDFIEAPDNAYVGNTSSAVVFYAAEEIRATCFMMDAKVSITFSKSSSVPQLFTVSIKNVVLPEVQAVQQMLFSCGNEAVMIEAFDALLTTNSNNELLVLMQGTDGRIEMSLAGVGAAFKAANVSMLALGDKYVVSASARIPEFSIGVFDAFDGEDFSRPRPVRLGVPVISTVPGYIPTPDEDDTIPQAERDLLKYGTGTESRTMYFRVISNVPLASSMRDELRLQIALPDGNDMVKEPVDVELEYLERIVVNPNGNPELATGRDIFKAQYDFHREDTVNYVDGFAYLSVYLPMTIQRHLPLKMQVEGTGSGFGSTAPVEGHSTFSGLSVGAAEMMSAGEDAQVQSLAEVKTKRRSTRKKKSDND